MRKILSVALIAVFMVYITLLSASGAQGEKLVALTFDDGPSGEYTPQLLDGLKERGVKVTFFTLGQCAQRYPDVVRRAYEEGHQIATHTWDHLDLTERTDEQIKQELERCFDLLDEICGREGEYLVRPPYGYTDSRVRAAVDAPLVCWSVDPMDWDALDSQVVCQRIVEDAFDGAIILCHDIHSTTIPAALEAIDILLEEGYEFVTVSELFRRRGVTLEDGELYYRCEPNGTDLGPIPVPEVSYTLADSGMATVTVSAAADLPLYYSTGGEWVPYAGPIQVKYAAPVRVMCVYDFNGGRSNVAELVWEPLPTEPAEQESVPQDEGKIRWDLPAPAVPLALCLLTAIFGGEADGLRRRCRNARRVRFRGTVTDQKGSYALYCAEDPDGCFFYKIRSSGGKTETGVVCGEGDGPGYGAWLVLCALRTGKLTGCEQEGKLLNILLEARQAEVCVTAKKGRPIRAWIHGDGQSASMEFETFHIQT